MELQVNNPGVWKNVSRKVYNRLESYQDTERRIMMTILRAALTFVFVLSSYSLALAQQHSRDIFVSPQTGVGVGSVWGVFIGVSQYKKSELNLAFADKDAEALYQFFFNHFQGKIPPHHFKVLTNSQASRGNILRAVGEVLRQAQPEDLVILSLAMHGILDERGEDLYFLTHDADPGFPEDDGISRHDLLRQIERSKARKIVLFLDACHTGAFTAPHTLLSMRAVGSVDINRLLISMGRAQDGIAVFSSSSAAERSQEGENFCGGHGAFTCAILTGLQGKADSNHNGLVELRELYDFTYRTVKTSTGGDQNPAIEGRYDNGLPLAYTSEGLTITEAPPSAVQPQGTHSPDMALILKELQNLKRQLGQVSSPPAAAPPLLEAKVVPDLPKRMTEEILTDDGVEMVFIPEGEFLMGRDEGDRNERPRHRVTLPAFYIDKYEVTISRYSKFLLTTQRRQPLHWDQSNITEFGNYPVIGVTWHDAAAYCQWAGKRLPTEAEWEKAARGTEGWRFPWGNEGATKHHANFDRCCDWKGYSTLTVVGNYEGGMSPYGAFDMAGNVWEWTADWYDELYYRSTPTSKPKGPATGTSKVVRGGSWLSQPEMVGATIRSWYTPDSEKDYIGFRCAKDAS